MIDLAIGVLQITNTLLELLNDRELSDINIGEITEKAEVSRNSFYRNYTDKEDIIKKYIFQLLSEWNEEWKGLLRLSSAEPRVSQTSSSNSNVSSSEPNPPSTDE